MTPEQIAALIAAGVPEAVRQTPTLRAFEARVDDVDADERTVVAVINTAAIDRYRTVITPKGARLDNYRKNPVVLFNHDAGSPPIGRNLWVKYRKAKNDLIAKTYFDTDDFSESIFQKVSSGSLRAWSIRFEPDYSKCGPPTEEEIRADKSLRDVYFMYRVWELLEYSAVTIGGNADCLTDPDARSARMPEDVAKYLQDLAPEQPARTSTDPAPEPVPAEAPEPTIVLPSLAGARTFAQVHAELVAPIRQAQARDAATRALKDAIGRARGHI